MCKVLEKMMNKRLSWYLEEYKIIMSAQSGFISGRSSINNLVVLHEYINEAFSYNQEVIAAIFDIESVFDSLSLSLVLKKVEKCNLFDNISSLIENFLQSRISRLLSNGEISSRYTVTKGVPQD